MDADEMKKKFDLFFCCKSYTALSLSASVGQLSKGRTDIGQTFQELISDIISVLCDKRNEEISETAVSIFVFLPFYR